VGVKADCEWRFGVDTAENPKRNLTQRRRGRGVNAEKRREEKRRKEFNTESTEDTEGREKRLREKEEGNGQARGRKPICGGCVRGDDRVCVSVCAESVGRGWDEENIGGDGGAGDVGWCGCGAGG
jgi:hypothetical protein